MIRFSLNHYYTKLIGDKSDRLLEALRQALIEGEESGESDLSYDEIIAEAKAELHAR